MKTTHLTSITLPSGLHSWRDIQAVIDCPHFDLRKVPGPSAESATGLTAVRFRPIRPYFTEVNGVPRFDVPAIRRTGCGRTIDWF